MRGEFHHIVNMTVPLVLGTITVMGYNGMEVTRAIEAGAKCARTGLATTTGNISSSRNVQPSLTFTIFQYIFSV